MVIKQLNFCDTLAIQQSKIINHITLIGNESPFRLLPVSMDRKEQNKN